MRALSFAKRVFKEIVRDPLTSIFGLGFPVILLLLLTAIQSNVPVELFVIDSLAPGIAVFGLSFITLFSASVVAGDRESSFLSRLRTTPMRSFDFIIGYTLPMLPLALLQTAICYFVAFLLGLELSVNALIAWFSLLPTTLFFIFVGLLCGSVLTSKQVGGICGALLTNLTAWLSGTWFDINLVGDGFSAVAKALPFVHAVEIGRSILSGSTEKLLARFAVVIGYAVVFCCFPLSLSQRKRAARNVG